MASNRRNDALRMCLLYMEVITLIHKGPQYSVPRCTQIWNVLMLLLAIVTF